MRCQLTLKVSRRSDSATNLLHVKPGYQHLVFPVGLIRRRSVKELEITEATRMAWISRNTVARTTYQTFKTMSFVFV